MQSAWPAQERCFDIVPEHTTHYTLLAEGFDGTVATRSFTLSVQTPAAVPVRSAPSVRRCRRRTTTRTHSRTNS